MQQLQSNVWSHSLIWLEIEPEITNCMELQAVAFEALVAELQQSQLSTYTCHPKMPGPLCLLLI